MAISNSDITAFPDRTPAILLKATDEAIVQVLLAGQAYSSVHARNYTRADLKELRDLKRELENIIQEDASPTGGLTALADFGDV